MGLRIGQRVWWLDAAAKKIEGEYKGRIIYKDTFLVVGDNGTHYYFSYEDLRELKKVEST